MITYQDLVEGVRDRAGLSDAREAREVTGAVLGSLVRAVPESDRSIVVGSLPAPVQGVAEIPIADGADGSDVADLLARIGRMLGRPPERARYLTQAVLDELGAQDGAMVDRIGDALPAGTLDALRATGDETARGPDGRTDAVVTGPDS